MTYPSLLLHLDDDARAEARNEQALRLATRLGSHVDGLSCRRPPVARLDAAASPSVLVDVLTAELDRARQASAEREQRFRAQCDRLGVASFQTDIDEIEETGRALLRRAPVHDLVVLGQPDPADPRAGERRAVLDDVVRHSPRPTLVLPHAGQFDDFGHAPLVAWDGSHGAARAVADALPLLRRARVVHVVQFDPDAGESGAIEQSPLAGIACWLLRHGIQARASVRYVRGGIGDALLSHAADVDADLLVMGCWGHARWAERLLGGATHTVMSSMTVPVLTSH